MKNEELQDSKNEVKHPTKSSHLKRVLALAAIGAIGAGVAGCSEKATSNAQPTPGTIKTELASPSATPESTPSPNQYTSAMERYAQMDVPEYESLDLQERLKYSQYLLDSSVYSQMDYSTTYGKYGNYQEYAVKYTPPSPANTGQQILDNELFVMQDALLQLQEGASSPTLDHTKADEVFGMAFYDIDESRSHARIYSDYLKLIDDTQEPTPLSGGKMTAIKTSELMSGKDVNGAEKQFKIITFEQDGKTLYGRYIYQQFTSYDSSDKGVWLLDVYVDKLSDLDAEGSIH